MINQDKPTSSVTNSAKTSIGETWDTWVTPWEDETRSWDLLSKLIKNFAFNKTGIGYLLLQTGGRLLQENGFGLIISRGSTMINQDKP